MLQEIKNYLDNLDKDRKTETVNDLLSDNLYLTKCLDTDYLFCDLRGDIDVVTDLTKILEKFNINRIYYPLDSTNFDYDMEEFEDNGWRYKEEKRVGKYKDEVIVLER